MKRGVKYRGVKLTTLSHDFFLPVYVDISGLSNPMTAILGLCVHGRVPITVVEDDRVCASQVDA